MDIDIVTLITDKFSEIENLLKNNKIETKLVMNVSENNILIGLIYEDTEKIEVFETKILKKINTLKKYIDINNTIIGFNCIFLHGSKKGVK